MKMGRRLRCSSSRIDLDMLLHRASLARTALPTARFDRNATTPVTDLVHYGSPNRLSFFSEYGVYGCKSRFTN
jgi:hypothetical protein